MIGSIVIIIVLGFLLSLIYVYIKSNQSIDEMILPYNDYVVLEDGRIKHVYAIMDIKTMRQKQSLEAIYPEDIAIVAYHSYIGAPQNIENHCEDKSLSNSQILVIINQIKKNEKV